MKEQAVLKTLVFQRLDTQQATIEQHEIYHNGIVADMSPFLQKHCPVRQNKISVYNPCSEKFEALSDIRISTSSIPLNYIQPSFIMFRFIHKTFTYEKDKRETKEADEGLVDKIKLGKSKPKTIKDVLYIVKKWRNIYLYGQEGIRRRMNLQQAAQILKVSKKSLDDYYCQLRLGQKYGFDFQSNIDASIGTIRRFTKDLRPLKSEQSIKKYERLPRKLKILENFDLTNKTLSFGQKPNSIRSFIKTQFFFQPPRNRPERKTNVLLDNFDNFEKSQIIDQAIDSTTDSFLKSERYYFKDVDERQNEQEMDPYHSIGMGYGRRAFDFDSNSFMLEGSRL